MHTASEKGGKENRKSGIFSGGTKSAREDRVPVKKKTPAQEGGVENFRIYRVEADWMQRRPKRGSRTPVRIAAAWLNGRFRKYKRASRW